MSKKPKRPAIAGLRPDGPWDAQVCNYCFDLPHRRPRKPYRSPKTQQMTTGCPGCGQPWMPEQADAAGLNAALLEKEAWELLSDQTTREQAGVASFDEAAKFIVELYTPPDPNKPEGKPSKHCRYCAGLPHRRPIERNCPGCGLAFAPEMLPIPTGLASTMAGIPDLDSIA